MTAVGGSIIEANIGGRIFAVPADNEAQLQIGGDNNEVQMNGNKTGRLIKTVVAAGIDGLLVSIDHSNDDLEYLQDMANLKSFQDCSFTLMDGSVWGGTLQITGELKGSTQSATAAVSLMGPGTLTQQ